eukprot:COSAG03_NODE_2463_length_2730_cov_10.291904_5_plen_79_part_00
MRVTSEAQLLGKGPRQRSRWHPVGALLRTPRSSSSHRSTNGSTSRVSCRYSRRSRRSASTSSIRDNRRSSRSTSSISN